MGTLAEYHHELTVRQKEILVAIWNQFYTAKINIGVLPFVDSFKMRNAFNFYTEVSEETRMYPKAFTLLELVEQQPHIRHVLYEATKKPEWRDVEVENKEW